MTVRELAEQLSDLPQDAEVTSCWDCMTHMPMHGALLYDGRVVLDVYHTEPLTLADLAEFDYGKPASPQGDGAGL